MIRKAFFLLPLLFLYSGLAQSDGITSRLQVGAIEIRESGYHGLFLFEVVPGPDSNVDFPDEGCDLVDRGVINENIANGKSLFAALIKLNPYSYVIVKVSGCEFVNGFNTLTAPKIVMLKQTR